MQNLAPVGFLMYEQSIKIGTFFKEKCVFEKTTLIITFKHHLSEMYILHTKAQSLSFLYAKQQPSFPSLIGPSKSWKARPHDRLLINILSLRATTQPPCFYLFMQPSVLPVTTRNYQASTQQFGLRISEISYA